MKRGQVVDEVLRPQVWLMVLSPLLCASVYLSIIVDKHHYSPALRQRSRLCGVTVNDVHRLFLKPGWVLYQGPVASLTSS